MQNIGLLLYYSIGFFLVSFLHSSYHKKYFEDDCKACISHSYKWPLVIFIYSFIIGSITIFYINNYNYILIMLIFVGTIPITHILPITGRPIIISSQTIWLFCMMIGLITSIGVILNNIEITPAFTSKLSSIGFILIILCTMLGIVASKILSSEHDNETLKKIFNQGGYYIIISTLIIAFGVLFNIIIPILFK